MISLSSLSHRVLTIGLLFLLSCFISFFPSFYFSAPDGSSDRALFELHQSQLEKFTDELQGLTEQPIETLMTAEARTKLISFQVTVTKFRNAVMEAIEALNSKTNADEELEVEMEFDQPTTAASSSAPSSKVKKVLPKRHKPTKAKSKKTR